ncbi:MAG: phosphoribosylanthranilate isomerase [Lachnospiraceae bacterium]|jgi:phosphoribosylanthranilate isomerase|nr:phosphoribosylanthranilate isomerase [Lachnospiraceae bacterium]
MSTEIKICGLTRPEEARMLNSSRADYAGFVLFYEKSRRNNTVQNAWQVLRYLDRNIKRVAVVVSPTLEQVKMIEQMDFHIIQVHGKLSDEVLGEIKLPVWRAYNIQDEMNPEEVSNPKICGYVLDGAKPGSGEAFDWEALGNFQRGDKTLILAGGLHAGNVERAMEILRPDVVDVSSGVEGQDGKDAVKIKEFIGKVRRHG